MRVSCGQEETVQEPFPNDDVDLCGRCYNPWEWSWQPTNPDPKKFCLALAQDDEQDSKFEATCIIAEDMQQRSWNPEEVKLTRRVGWNLVHNFRVVKDDELQTKQVLPEKVSASDCGFKSSTVKIGSATGIKGTIVQSDSRPFIEVQRIDSIFVDQQEVLMSSGKMLQTCQGAATMKREVGKLESSMPVGLRGHTAPPTFANIENAAKVVGVGTKAAAGKAAVEDSPLDYDEGEEGEEEEPKEVDEEVAPDDDDEDGKGQPRHTRRRVASPSPGISASDGKDGSTTPKSKGPSEGSARPALGRAASSRDLGGQSGCFGWLLCCAQGPEQEQFEIFACGEGRSPPQPCPVLAGKPECFDQQARPTSNQGEGGRYGAHPVVGGRL
jgi:hypothetical protein